MFAYKLAVKLCETALAAFSQHEGETQEGNRHQGHDAHRLPNKRIVGRLLGHMDDGVVRLDRPDGRHEAGNLLHRRLN